MKTKTGFIEGVARTQAILFPELHDDYINDESSIRVIDMFVDNHGLAKLEFKNISAKTGRPGYPPFHHAQVIYLQLSESHTVITPIRTRSKT